MPLNFLKQDFCLFERAIVEKLPASYYWHLQNAFVLKDTIFINFKFWDEYSHISSLHFKSKLKRILLLLFRKRQIQKGVWITDNWSSGYFHWFSDALTRLEAVRPFLSGHIVLLPENYKSCKFICQSLEILKYSYMFLNDRLPNRVSELYLPSHTARTGNFNPHIIKSLRERFLSAERLEKPFRKIYISRKKAKRRRLLNEEQFLLTLINLNFEIHYFEDYTLQQQIKLMSECMMLVGIHGAGLTNMLFMQPGTSVIELRKEDDHHNNCFFSMASALDINYYYFKCKANNSYTQDADFEIPEQEIQKFTVTFSEKH